MAREDANAKTSKTQCTHNHHQPRVDSWAAARVKRVEERENKEVNKRTAQTNEANVFAASSGNYGHDSSIELQ